MVRVQEMQKLLIRWFHDNLMKANIDKFQFMLLCPNVSEKKQTDVVQVDDVILSSQEGAKLLGVHIDRQLLFNIHVKQKCAKANCKVQVPRKLTSFLTEDCSLKKLRCITFYLLCTTFPF